VSRDRPLRLFCALDVPPDVRSALDAWWVEQPVPPAGLKRVPAQLLHVTVTFFGAVAPDRVDELGRRLARAASRHPAVGLGLAGGGRFDGRVLWARVVGDVARLRALERSTTAAGRRASLTVDRRGYRPHVTLARSRRPVDLRPWSGRLAQLRSPTWTADRLVLLRSDLAAGGPAYTPVAAWPLAAGSAQGGRHDDDDEHDECQRDDPPPQPGSHQA
jgi:2'-5' RNA ligase